MTAHYRAPGWFTRNVVNHVVQGLARMGVSVRGSRILRVRGRKTGELRMVPVNMLTYEGARYLVAPRGETQWVRNLRAARGNGELALGRKIEAFHGVELGDDEKPPVLRAYLERWKAEVGVFFDGVSADSPDADVRRIAPQHPTFHIETR